MSARILLLIGLLLASANALAGPKIQHWMLSNGARVYFVESRELPMLQVRVVFDAGSSRDPVEKAGVANLTAAMLDEGTNGLTADDIASRFEGVGAEFGAGIDRDMASVNLRSLSDSALLDPALDLFARVLAAPAYPAENLERQRAQALVSLQKDAQSPGAIAEKAFYREMYGQHPYASDPPGSEQSLKAITRGDLLAFHRRHYVGANAWVVIVGDASKRRARNIAERVIGKLPAGKAPPPLPPVRTLYSGWQKRINFPATQTHINMGHPGVRRGDPDYFPLYVGNYILGGGGLVSRLSAEVREKHGLSYSVYSYFLPLRMPGPLFIGLQTKNAQRDQALKLVRQVISDYVAKGPTDAELEAAKKHITGSFPLRLDSNGKIAENLAVIGFYGLPLTYLDDFIPRVEAVTAAQIRQAFRRRVHPEHMVTVTVGGGR
ncbi:MAG: zinc protease [Candidatus Muproteobacteria bacterium RIFCSPHIGHO2_12_FULL_60_33]|uniref:Zinc protease n=1 Tax=Candidatus Muproteobacteria bacterium RIFCSPLOWO2_01_FULL_60_18 TaxID=1817768 RepID=A0A1F6U416_9PROT|nr:MAG: zinc protease [Candidatus Muproteobacteria bacterium RIFCSPLOWO2_01_FULL_60_18]OGI53677.1 MAG: zinc protease [Candidatus Muproteobacteria bacterium RIFCSPHIGHO2_02_FULL_60_13]OGI55345.1 MAG: zinc protease [Candidatus Muproteobacteria bacterium RIFCSPHIGHO2_12_FULL_60_33]